jgi:molecular chaperone GrpE
LAKHRGNRSEEKTEIQKDSQEQPVNDETLADEAEAHISTEEEVVEEFHALYEELEKARAERDEVRDQLIRTMADFKNFRTRSSGEVLQIRQYATQSLVTDLLPVLDNFARSLSALQSGASIDSIREGIQAVDRQLRGVLESTGLRRIESEGQVFDPEVHEAIGVEERDDVDDNTVVAELEGGYRMGDRVIRPARVRLSRKP